MWKIVRNIRLIIFYKGKKKLIIENNLDKFSLSYLEIKLKAIIFFLSHVLKIISCKIEKYTHFLFDFNIFLIKHFCIKILRSTF